MPRRTDEGQRPPLKRFLDRILSPRIQYQAHTYSRPHEREACHQSAEQRQSPTVPRSRALRASRPYSSSAPPSFPKFALLPYELRIQIWELGLFSTPRVVRFDEIISKTSTKPFSNLPPHDLLLCTPIPSSLQICHETRELALKRYIFSEGGTRLYLDPEIDSLYFRSLDSYSLNIFACCSKIEDLRRLRGLVVDERDLRVLGNPVWNDLGPKPFEGPAFRLFNGLEELTVILKPDQGKARGQSTLGPLFYERHCQKCQRMDWWVGLDGWILPTYLQFVSAERNGIEDVVSENAYEGMLNMAPRERSWWLQNFANRRMKQDCRADFDVQQRRIRACSVMGLHRFIDLLDE